MCEENLKLITEPSKAVLCLLQTPPGSVHTYLAIYIYLSNKMWLYTVYYVSINCSLYMFWVVISPIIRSTYNCNYGIWHWSNCLYCLPLSWSCCSNSSTTAKGSRDGLTSARCCNYSYMCSWWWVELPPKTCRASSLQKYNKLYIVTSCWTIIDIDSRCTDPWT